ncbi:MAG: hypothetical protein ACRDI2_06115 [Chloroflexota bacterium]
MWPTDAPADASDQVATGNRRHLGRRVYTNYVAMHFGESTVAGRAFGSRLAMPKGSPDVFSFSPCWTM